MTMDPVTFLLTVVLCLILASRYQKRNIFKNLPPGPKPLPIIGNLYNLKIFNTLLELSKKYGAVFTIHLGTQKVVVLCGYETVKDALVNFAEEFSERPVIPIFKDVNRGYGIVFSHGQNWKLMRRFTLSALRDFGGKKIENKINEECDFLVKTFRSFKGKPFENTKIINSAVANVIVSILYGRRFDSQDPTFLRLKWLIYENIRLTGSLMVMLYNTFPSLMRWVPGNHKSFLRNGKELQNFFRKSFTEYRNTLDINDQRNLIDAFLVKQQEENKENGSYFHTDNLTILVANLFVAGTDTVAATLQWGILLMMKYPDIQKNVQNEIEKVIGLREPSIEHRKSMPYTNAVIHEIQRIATIIPNNLPRATTKDVTFRGYFIPKGTYVITLLTSVLKDKTRFEKPDEFYPQHFLDSEGNFVRNEAFLPFSAGKRICAGENLAVMELFLFFTRLFQNFTFQPPAGAVLDFTPRPGITTPPFPHEICALPRC
ncbi:hypothetical protein GDO86_010539 [Hymenochirus boettgeri]|nr:hypothetical protein GDO86_010539 [Hymenochirus boettgeri]